MGAFSSVLWCLLVSLYTVSYETSPWYSSLSNYTVALIFITWSSMETMPSDDQTILRKIYFKMSIWCITPPWEMISFISWSKVVRLSYQRFPVTALGLCRGLPIGSPCLDILQNIKIITLLHKIQGLLKKTIIICGSNYVLGVFRFAKSYILFLPVISACPTHQFIQTPVPSWGSLSFNLYFESILA